MAPSPTNPRLAMPPLVHARARAIVCSDATAAVAALSTGAGLSHRSASAAGDAQQVGALAEEAGLALDRADGAQDARPLGGVGPALLEQPARALDGQQGLQPQAGVQHLGGQLVGMVQ